jgi:large exoprotein involved in heme utilization and adhesion
VVAGQGNAGNIQINASDSVLFSGFSDPETRSGAFSTLEPGGVGRGGNIRINTGNLAVTNGAVLSTSTGGTGNAGQIVINANDTVTFSNGSTAFSTVEAGARGDSGGIEINTGFLEVSNGSALRAVVRSQGGSQLSRGKAGDIILNATENISIFGEFTEIVSSLEAASIGAGGNVIINTGNLSITEGAFLDVSTFGFGDAGNITINAADTVTLDDSVIQSSVSLFSVGDFVFDAEGNSGEITINTGNLFVTTGAQLLTQTEGRGNAGDITINATDQVLFEGFDSDGAPSLAFSTVKPGATGNSGNISITARSVEVKDGGTLTASVVANPPQIPPAGPSNAGSIEINASDNVLFAGGGASSFLGENTQGQGGSINIITGNLSVIDGASLTVSTAGIGNAGSIDVFASDSVLFSGGLVGENFNPISSGAFSRVESTGRGNSGSITITTGSLNVLNGASLETQVLGGDAGRFVEAGEIRIDTTGNVTFDGVGNSDSFRKVGDETRIAIENTGILYRSKAATTIASGVSGNSGDIIINAENLNVTNGALLEARNSGTGIAGDINIAVRNNATFDGSSFDEPTDEFELEDSVSQASTTIGFLGGGIGGDINISAINLSVTNGAKLEASIERDALGTAGNIIVNTHDNIFFDGVFQSESGVAFPSKAATILAEGAVGTGGDINITTTNLSVTNGAQLDVRTFGLLGRAGNVIVKASDSIFFDGFFDADNISGAFTTVEGVAENELTGIGLGGDITLFAENISLSNFAQLKTAAIGFGNAGNIFITTGNLLATDNAEIQAQVDGFGAAGNVGITARNSVSIDNSRVFTTVEPESLGEGGGIEINTGNLFVTNGGQLQAQINEFAIGDAGKILINASDSVFFDGANDLGYTSRVFTSINPGAEGTGGDITINARNLSVTNGAGFSADTSGIGNAGNVILNISDRVSFDGFFLDAANEVFIPSSAESAVLSGAMGEGGGIFINTNNISFTNRAILSTSTSGEGNAGRIIIQALEDVYFDDSNAFSTVEVGAVAFSAERTEVIDNQEQRGTIYISAEDLLVTNGSQLQTLTRGQGNAGRVIIETTDNVRFEGLSSAALSSVEGNAIGVGGDVVIRTNRFSLHDGARLSAENNVLNSANKAGNIWVDAEVINMDNAETIGVNNTARIVTSTKSGDGGDIGISARDIIMQNGSQIRTDAGQANLPGSGGDITINAELLVGLHRSHIAANAFNGSGGEMKLDNIEGRFGFEFYSRERLEKLFGAENLTEFKPENLPRSSITSISRTEPELSGDVELNEFDPTRGLIELPRIVVDPNDLINQDPCKQGQESELYIRGRGGIQVTPDDKLDGGEIEVDLVEPTPSRQRNRRDSTPDQSRTKTEENQPISSLDIVPARGWIRDENGDVILVDYDPTQTGVQRPQHRQNNPNICQPVSENQR